MNERIIFTKPDGSCGVLIPTGVISIDALIEKDVPDGCTNIRKITVNELPVDRVFRNAWDDSNAEDFVGIDIGKAVSIAHNMRRHNRELKLSPLDKESLFSTTTNERKTQIESEKKTILSDNGKLQNKINLVADEAALRKLLSDSGII